MHASDLPPVDAVHWLTINQAARYAAVARRTIYNWIAGGTLVVRKTPGGQTRIAQSSLLTIAPSPPPSV